MSFQIRPTAGYRRGAVSMICELNLLQSLIEQRPEKASLCGADVAGGVG